MAQGLIFGNDGVMREGESVLARVVPGEPGAYARIEVGEHANAIVREGRNGWHFRLLEADGRGDLCEFHTAWLGRGGVLKGASLSWKLRAHLWRSHEWAIAPSEGAPVTAVARPGRVRAASGEETGRVRLAAGIAPELALSCADAWTLAQAPRAPLAFACWLIVQWELMPSVPSGPGTAGP